MELQDRAIDMEQTSRHAAILWDMDGVLVDTWKLHSQTWLQAFYEYKVPLDENQIHSTFGMNSLNALQLLLGDQYQQDFLIEVIDRKEALFHEVAREGLEPLPGVTRWLDQFRAQGIRQAVASSAPPDNIDIVVDTLGIRAFFDALVSGVDLPGKPHPDVFLKAARLMGVTPDHCLVIEDAVHGVHGAHRAGMKCIAVTTTTPAEVLREADLVLADLSELSEAHLVELFGPG